MIADADIWQVMCGGDIYQADLATLKQWIAEGLVQPSDQVRKGNLRWLEAGRVPSLRRAFTGEEQPGEPPAQPPAHAFDSHAQHQHGGGFQQAAHDLPVYPVAPAQASNPAPQQQYAPQQYAPQPVPPQGFAPDPPAVPSQSYAPDPFAPPPQTHSSDPFAQTVHGPAPDPFAPTAPQYAGDVFVSPAQADFAAPAPDAFDEPRYSADPARYAPETSHYAVAASGFTPEAASYAPAAPHFDATPAAEDAYAAHDAHAADPFYVPQSDQPAAAYEEAAPQYAHVPDRREFAERASAAPSLRALGRACYAHPHLQPRFVCRVCQTPMCADCVKFVDASNRVALCPLCGDICNDYREVYQQARNRVRKSSGFGLGDFGEAVGYPFRNLVGLIGISLVYSILALGGIKGQILAYIVIFGCMSLVIKQLAWGRLDRGFLPDFSSMSLWDDVAVPCFLGIGVTLITWGLAIVIFIALLWGVFTSVVKQPATVTTHPGLAMHEEQFIQAERDHKRQKRIEAGLPPEDPEEVAREEALAAEQAAGEGENAFDPETGAFTPVKQLMKGAYGPVLLLLPLLAIALLWGFFYYPMALAVAGYTEDFWAVVNPMVGFDTIRRMGWNYVKVFFMYAFVWVIALIAKAVIYYSLSAFTMPIVGNLPASFIEGGISFYTSLVIAALLGLALYKSSDRLGIATD